MVETEAAKEQVQHRLVIIAPAYNGYRHTVLTAIHNRHLAYPAEVRAKSLAVQKEVQTYLTRLGPPDYETVYPSANSDEDMVSLVARALRSTETKAAVLSLIAKSNEAKRSPVAGEIAKSDPPNDAGEPQAGPKGSEMNPKN